MIKELFQKHQDEYIRFGCVENKFSQRRDLHALILLDKLIPGKKDMVSAAEHDQIWLDVTPQELEGVATEEQIVELIRCGVRCESEYESLSMWA